MMRTALVTGASAGLGRELVRQLVRDRGMTVLATARRGDRLEDLARELGPDRVPFLPGDLADPAFRERLWHWAEETSGGLDLLVNNAGLGHYSEFATQDPVIIRQVVEVNFLALCDLTQRGLKHMLPRGSGQILQVASLLGFMGLPYSSVYVATKHAVVGLVRSLRCELRGTGVRVWAACPGRTESEFYQVALGVSGMAGHSPRSTPTDRVVRAIVRGLDRRCAFLVPDPPGKALAALSHWLPAPFTWAMEHWSATYFAQEIDAARGAKEPRTK